MLSVTTDGPTATSAAPVDPASAAARDAGPTDPYDDVRAYRSVRDHVPVPAPTAVSIPAIGVHSRLQRLGVQDDGAIEIPDAWAVAGWYARGVRPGQVGPAVIFGHVDSRRGPAVFYRVDDLHRGDRVHVDRADGSRVTFVVDRVERHAKTRFPSDDVYLPTLKPTLRLVTCGGTFDTAAGHYRDNVVVFADLAP